MGCGVYYQPEHERWAGYGVPAPCDWPTCDALIDRGRAYECKPSAEDEEPHGCGLFFCSDHDRDHAEETRVDPKPDTREWIRHVLTDPAWYAWRDINPDLVARMLASLKAAHDE